MKLLKSLFMVASLVSFAFSAWALDIDAAKEQGLIGETKSGYISAVAADSTADVAAFVVDINRKRKQKYASIAKKRGIPLKSVENLAAKKAYEKTKVGHFIQDASGNWRKK